MKYVIGIDASTTKTGVSVYRLNKSGRTLVQYFLIDAEKESPIPTEYKLKKGDKKTIRKQKSNQRTRIRVEYTIEKLLQVLRDYQKKGEIVRIGMEDTYGTTDPSSIKSLARIQGAVYGVALVSGVELIFISPNSWRSKVGIPLKEKDIWLKRDALKKLSVTMVKEKHDIEVGDDIADAILIGEVV